MKQKSKAKFLIGGVVGMLFAVGLGVSAITPVDASVASAATGFVMEEKASARLADSSSGIRFRVEMDETTKDALVAADSSGMLIFPKAYLTDTVYAAQAYHDAENGLADYVDANTEGKLLVYEDGGSWWANGCIVNIQEANYELEYSAIAYYKTGDTYTYASVSQAFSRSVTNVLSRAYLEDADDRAKIDSYCAWFGTSEATPIRINEKEDFEYLAKSVSADNTYEGKYVNIEESFDFGEGDGSEITAIPKAFVGTLTVDDGVALTYKSTADFVPLAENYALLKGVYTCAFDMASEWTDKVVSVNRSNLNITNGVKSYETTDSDVATITGATISKVKGYKKAAYNYFFAVNFGFDIEDYLNQLAGYTHLQFKLAYTLAEGKSYVTSNAISGFNQQGQYGLMSGTVFDEENAKQWKTYEFSLAEIIENQEKNTKDDGFVRLFYTTQAAASAYNVYVADVQFVEKELEPMNLTSKLSTIGGTTTSKGMTTSTEDTTISSITGALPAGATSESVTSVYRFALYNQDLVLTLGDTVANLMASGYTHLTVYIASNSSTQTFAATAGAINFTGITKGSVDSNKWLSYAVALADLDSTLEELTLFTTTIKSGALTTRYVYAYAELVRVTAE